jgi:hypothetical protein
MNIDPMTQTKSVSTPSETPRRSFIRRSASGILNSVLALNEFHEEQIAAQSGSSSNSYVKVQITEFPKGHYWDPPQPESFMRFPEIASDKYFTHAGDNYYLYARILIEPAGADSPFRKDVWTFKFSASASIEKEDANGALHPVPGAPSPGYASVISCGYRIDNSGEASLVHAHEPNPVPPQYSPDPSEPGQSFRVSSGFQIDGINTTLIIEGRVSDLGMAGVKASITGIASATTKPILNNMGFSLFTR